MRYFKIILFVLLLALTGVGPANAHQPENSLISARLPKVSIISPSGKKWEMKINERTSFFEPFGGTNYFFLSRLSEVAEAGTYGILISSRSKASITIAIRENEVPGKVIRGGLG